VAQAVLGDAAREQELHEVVRTPRLRTDAGEAEAAERLAVDQCAGDAAVDVGKPVPLAVSLARGTLGSLQSVGLQVALNGLQTSTTNLTTAQGQIKDTDFAATSADYARENIIYQSATAMLAQANQVPQTVLNLLNGQGTSGS
jgi:flagellin